MYARRIEPSWLELAQVEISLPGLPAGFDGVRVAHLTDLHRGAMVPLSTIEAAFELALAQQPDLILLTGDYVTGDADYAAELVPLLRGLSAPLGVFAVLGNNDHWTDSLEVARQIRSGGVSLLMNTGAQLMRGGSALWLAGVDDVWIGRADLGSALTGASGEAPALLLAHEPDFADTVAASPEGERVLLQLSGHTHGGQVRLPGGGAPYLPYLGRKYPYGLYRVGAMQLYVCRGVGLSWPGVRVNCRPEVALLTLRAA